MWNQAAGEQDVAGGGNVISSFVPEVGQLQQRSMEQKDGHEDGHEYESPLLAQRVRRNVEGRFQAQLNLPHPASSGQIDLCFNSGMQVTSPQRIKSDDAEIYYWTMGDGPPVVLLHPFPAHHEFWLPVSEALATRYRLILPDLRGHGESGIGEGLATMSKHASDIARVMDDAEIGRAPMIGVSIGGYVIFQFWRKYPGRIAAIGLSNTKAAADNAEARGARLQAAADVLERGTEPFFESMIPKLLGTTTRENRPDLVDNALRMMRKMSPEDVAQVQRGMAERADSADTLKTINVPVLIVTGDEDLMTGVREAEFMRQRLASSQMQVIAKAGHYAPWEQPQAVARLLRNFLDAV